MNNINPINFQNRLQTVELDKNSSPVNTFGEMFKEQLAEVDQLVKDSEKVSTDFAAGKIDNVHDVMIAGEKAKTAVNLTTAIQSKALSAYEEIMRLQV
ncbi:MAG: flagellar hook-basal body complex protein FliE [Halanaerobium sp.]